MASCRRSSDDTVTACSAAIHVAQFGERPQSNLCSGSPTSGVVCSLWYGEPSFFFLFFAFKSVCRDSLVCLLAGPVINGEKLVLEPIYI
jgi:hypothetical protein